ncbi:aromatic-ring-hydroxylating dioxygenase subunit beta [Aurantiacibacter rhizosphaerae]|uniref:Aromatic-ring-hydroxylating dioxygenase subunit beta n=1 Tax=Aurantiacibacter rhizosphaerae TaxID=2691582 RepID=A0A844XHP3_9SPHN|nr:aromatic-ring-hydroxylating dioxygenase subunit beta [Aurantiacibacter rhizosphaerae]MWV29065.1 hypothetical protein [Aurantiacibacter rhizosphaerae]
MSDVMEKTATNAISLDEAIRFIWREAELLDTQDYAQWLDLWTPEGLYIIPIDRDGDARIDQLNVAYDDAEMRAARTKRLKSGFSMSSAPSARTVRLVSRFVEEAGDDGSLTVRAAQQVVEYKFNRTRLLGADVTYRLVRDGDRLRLDHKEIRLLNSDDSLWGIGYLL